MTSTETKQSSGIIQTVGDLCKVCYTCVRDCPAKAIRIIGGQAQVIPERCITCGNCVRVCKQKAKRYKDAVNDTINVLKSDAKEKIAIVAPSFPAEFDDINKAQLVSMLRTAGFTKVCQVAAGADLVAREYKKLIEQNPKSSFIATTCPAIVSYIEKYQPEMIKFLAPICSPMIAAARIAKARYGKDSRVIFIGPCVAKKNEALRYPDDVDFVITFEKLRELFKILNIQIPPADVKEDFDPPHPGLGMLFPISRGLLQAANINEDLLSQDVIATDGKNNFPPAVEEFASGNFEAKLLELLCCKGCISGPCINSKIPLYKKRKLVSEYAKSELKRSDNQSITDNDINLSAVYRSDVVPTPQISEEQIKEVLARMGKNKPEDELDCGACGYPSCREHAIAIINGLAESEMCLPYVIEKLKKSISELNFSNSQLEKARQALVNAEKLASMGQLSAGIAHEINNPLGVILLNASLLLEGMPKDSENYEDLKLIVEQAEQCKKIVTGLLNFARKNKVLLQPVNLVEFLSERCVRAIVKPENIKITFENLAKDPIAEIDADQMAQVMTNLIVNAIEAMPKGGEIKVSLKDSPSEIKISVSDEGVGIPKEHINKIFEPFFTTKQMGKGTGLGLAVTYGIVKMHRGRIEVSSNTDPTKGKTGSIFQIIIPRKIKQY